MLPWRSCRDSARSAVAVGLAVLWGCGGDSGTGPDTPPVSVASISVTPSEAHVFEGETVTLTATPRSSGGVILTGQPVTWSSGDSTVATVSGGVVTGRKAGTVQIRATSGAATGTATITVDTKSGLIRLSGDAQIGLAGFALADSLAVRLFASNGQPLAGQSITWSATAGTVSPAASITDVAGYARTQWAVATGSATVTATATGLPAVTFSGRGNIAGTCQLAPDPGNRRFSLGPTDFTLNLDATKPISIVVLFVDFSDAPAQESPAGLMTAVVQPGLDILEEVSWGRLDIAATAIPKWYRMSQPIGSYIWSTFNAHKAYLTEALTLADADVDFSAYDAVYVITPSSQSQPVSPTFLGGLSNGLGFDGTIIRTAVTLGRDSRFYPAVVSHETGHMMGLVDLYAYDPNGGNPFSGDQFRFTGAWSLMANVFLPGHFFAWEKRKLGWLEASQFTCLGPGEGVEVVLDPVETPGGLEMVAMPTGASTAIVAEVRRQTGLDAHLCSEGVLLYDIDVRTASGFGPIRIRGARQSTGACGPWGDATFGLGAGRTAALSLPDTVEMRILGVDSGGGYRVRLKR